MLAKTGTTTLPNGQAAASRILTYLSIAQHRAALAAEAGKDGSKHPSVSVAIGAASVVVLSQFYPLSASGLETRFDTDLTAPGWPGRKNQDVASGEAIGRAVGAALMPAWECSAARSSRWNRISSSISRSKRARKR